MKPVVEVCTVLELRIMRGPCEIRVQNETVVCHENQDAGVLILMTVMGRRIMHEQIIAVTCDPRAFMNLREFVCRDGGITLHRDIASSVPVAGRLDLR